MLREVNLRVRPGEYVAFVGPSGSGKSTLMHILGCLDTPTGGTYLLDGEDVSHLDPHKLCMVRREKIGFVFQGFQLLGKLTALENVAFPLMLRGISESERGARAMEALRRVGLARPRGPPARRAERRPAAARGHGARAVLLSKAAFVRRADRSAGRAQPE